MSHVTPAPARDADSAPGTSVRSLYRTAGWGGVGAFVAWAG